MKNSRKNRVSITFLVLLDLLLTRAALAAHIEDERLNIGLLHPLVGYSLWLDHDEIERLRRGVGIATIIAKPPPAVVAAVGVSLVLLSSADELSHRHGAIVYVYFSGTIVIMPGHKKGEPGPKFQPVDVRNPTAVTDSVNHPQKQVTAIAAGTSHSLLLFKDGHVASFGSNAMGQLGTADFPIGSRVSTPTRVTNNVKSPFIQVKAIAVGANHCLLLKEDSTVHSFGSNSHGQLGTNQFNIGDNVDTPTAVIDPDTGQAIKGVIAIAAGGDHSLLLKADGRVYSFGSNSHGQLGALSVEVGHDSLLPALVTDGAGNPFIGVTHIAAGDNHSLLRKGDGSVHSFGSNSHGQLGSSKFNIGDNVRFPTAVTDASGTAFSQVEYIAAGTEHSLLLKADHTVHSFGSNSHGQLGSVAFPVGVEPH